MKNIRNFSIIAHIDHGKSTLADRFLEVTGTIEKRKMKDQVLDSMELERERGITIKMQPVRMLWHPDRRTNAEQTQNNAEFIYSDLTYKIRGALFSVRKGLGLGHKELVYHNALEIEFRKAGLAFESKKNIPIQYDGKTVGTYQPDFIIEGKILIELKALPEIGRPQVEQTWSYLKGCNYRLALLVNFGSRDLEIKRIAYDTARYFSASSALGQRESAGVSHQIENEPYVLNLIDTPGHIDFSYEVSRALKAVEGAILLVDATQGVQAQTLSTLSLAREQGLTIIPAVSKVDSPLADVPRVRREVAQFLGCEEKEIIECSGKTGQGVEELIEAVISRVPAPRPLSEKQSFRGLVFDFQYSDHKGVVVFTRVFDGAVRKGDKIVFASNGREFTALEVGVFTPAQKAADTLSSGEIGYIVTGIKEPGVSSVGDTIGSKKDPLPALPGYLQPKPVVWASVYPESQDDFTPLRQALARLRLSDASLSYEEESSGALGRGFRCGFLGMLHLEIVTERLRREFNLTLIVSTPTITYEVATKDGKKRTIYSPSLFPEYGQVVKVFEPWVKLRIITPEDYVGSLMQILYDYEAEVGNSESFGGGRLTVSADMPLRELMRGFFDKLKTATSGYASLSYEIGGMREAEVTRLDLLVADELIPAFTRIVGIRKVQEEAEAAAEKLHKILPRQLFALKIQGRALGRILSSRSISALRKDVTGYLYGGDITRKMKLLEKQKKGKKKMKERGKVNIPHDVFLKMVRSE